MLQDGAVSQAVLQRVDSLSAKLGVAAGALWGGLQERAVGQAESALAVVVAAWFSVAAINYVMQRDWSGERIGADARIATTVVAVVVASILTILASLTVGSALHPAGFAANQVLCAVQGGCR